MTPKFPDLTDRANESGSLMLPRFLNNDEVVNAKSSGGFRLAIVDRVHLQFGYRDSDALFLPVHLFLQLDKKSNSYLKENV